MSEIKTNKISSLDSSNSDITLDPDGTGDVVVASGHNLGIGNTSPTAALSVHDSVNQSAILRIKNDSGDGCHNALTIESSTSADKNIGIRFKNQDAEKGGIGYVQSDKVAFYNGTSTSNGITIDSSGNVGIGTSTVSANTKLHVNAGTNLNFEVENASSTLRLSALNDARSANIPMQFASSSFQFISGGIFTQGISGSASAMANVKIDGNNELHKDTSARITKSEIADLHIGLDEVVALTPRKFKRGSNTAFEIGFIADEMASVAPEVVMRGPKSWITNVETDTEEIDISIEYDKLTALLTKAIQELKTDLDAEKAKTTTLQTQVADLITRVTALEAGE